MIARKRKLFAKLSVTTYLLQTLFSSLLETVVLMNLLRSIKELRDLRLVLFIAGVIGLVCFITALLLIQFTT